MASRLLYPRIPRILAQRLAEEIAAAPGDELPAMATCEHPLMTFMATGGERVTPERLGRLRDEILETAEQCGFPGEPSAGQRREFDRRSAVQLFNEMEIVPADAGSEDVWSFITCCVLPDVAAWRFPSRASERLVGDPTRNTFRRLWVRARLFVDEDATGDERHQLLFSLGEDEVVAIAERTAVLGASPRLARSVARGFLAACETHDDVQRMDLMRQGALRVNRLCGWLVPEILAEKQLDALIQDEFNRSAGALRAPRPETLSMNSLNPYPTS